MIEWLSRLFRPRPSSAQIAKNRLKVVLSYDRTNLTPEMLNVIQDDIVRVISQHLEIDRERMMVSTQRGDNGDHLIADIPIRSLRAPTPRRETTHSSQAPLPRRKRVDRRRR